MYFNVMGQGAACWLTFFDSPRYPELSIREMWNSSYYKSLRESVQAHDLTDRCRVCERNILNRAFKNTLARAYDSDRPVTDYPSIMEFEFSNQCNLECQMCNGRLSSSIRKNREKLPPVQSPYDEAFVDQLEEFIPHLAEARFNGGEPFLQKICWSVWERIIRINKNVEITIATNGTVWSDKVKALLESGNFRINLSLDGMSKETYESIRKNSKFDRVIANAEKFSAYCRSRGSSFCIMVNPMRPNWHELPRFVEFCNYNGYHIWFNTIYRPFHLALWTLSSSELKDIHKILTSHKFSAARSDSRAYYGNIEKYRNLVNRQIPAWQREQEERERSQTDYNYQKKLNENAKAVLLDKLASHLKHGATFDLAVKKLSHLEALVARNVSGPDFYKKMMELPADWLVHDLENKSSEQIAEELYYRAEYY
jgi:molybdenum cofactor biosynthesis enzyme MoaA